MYMDYADAIKEVYGHLEKGHVDKAVMTCVRIARSLQDYLSFAIFLREMCSGGKEYGCTFFDATRHLTKDTKKTFWEMALKRYLETRTLDFTLGSNDRGEDKNVLVLGVGELDPEMEQCERHIQDMTIPAGMGEYDTAAFTDQYVNNKAQYRLRIRAIQTIKERIKTRCFNYAMSIEHQLKAQRQPQTFLEGIQNEVNNYFRAHSEDVYTKLQKAAQLVDFHDSEDPSLLLTQVRRAIKAAADYFYPPATEPITCSDGKVRNLDNERYLDRLHEYLVTHFQKSASEELLRAGFGQLAVFVRRLNDVASKGVHAVVSAQEAKQGLLGLYMFLHNVVSLLQDRQSS